MRFYLTFCAMLLTGCDERIVTVYAVPSVPADLRRVEVISCPRGNTAKDFATCLFRLDAGLDRANSKIEAIDDILARAEAMSEKETAPD